MLKLNLVRLSSLELVCYLVNSKNVYIFNNCKSHTAKFGCQRKWLLVRFYIQNCIYKKNIPGLFVACW